MDRLGYAVLPRYILHDPEFPAHAKWVLLVLNSFVGDDGTCFPSQSTISLATGLSVSSIRRAVAFLEERGLVLTRTIRRADGRDGKVYAIRYDRFGERHPPPSP